MTDWVPGMACRIVEHDRLTGEPAENAEVFAAVVENVTGPVVEVRCTDARLDTLYTFYLDGWLMTAQGTDTEWRLLP